MFGGTIERVFFSLEIVSLLLYYYLFGKLNPKDHLIIGWLYFAFSWISLFIINGIVTFMLTRGGWLQTGALLNGFFNPSFLPSLLFKTLMAIIIAEIFALMSCLGIKNTLSREKMYRYCSIWISEPVLVLPFVSYWYLNEIAPFSKGMILRVLLK